MFNGEKEVARDQDVLVINHYLTVDISFTVLAASSSYHEKEKKKKKESQTINEV